jgi:hypothetical protein
VTALGGATFDALVGKALDVFEEPTRKDIRTRG